MVVKILPVPTKLPASDNNNWEFSVVVTDENGTQEPHPHVIWDPDLRRIFFEATGRHLNSAIGVTGDREELQRNWEVVEPKLQAHVEKWFREHVA